jgi:hypothetical protein
MDSFEMNFYFEHKRYKAEVTTLRGTDHIQYTVSPEDEHLLREYGNQVLHQFKGKPLQVAFPGSTEAQRAYAGAVSTGLGDFLEKQRQQD